MQPFVNVYTKFARKDGRTVWMHMDQWEGQDWKRSPGNLYGDPVQVTFDPKSTAPIALVADKVIPPIQLPAETDQVKRFKMQSRILSEWWGHPIYLGATVLLPRDYAKESTTRYPAVYFQGHFSTAAPGGFGRAGEFDKYWMADGTPQMIYITLQHPSPYYDDSYGVNSENNGPFGDAIIKELIPEIESRFRVVREPWGRLLSGGSTGGWIALAHQIFYPDFYGGTFSLCPDSVDFRAHQIVNIYDDANAYFLEKGWTSIERPNQRRPDGIDSVDDEGRELVRAGRWRQVAIGRAVGHLGSHLQPGRARRVSKTVVGQTDRRHRQDGRGGLEEVRPPPHSRNHLADARSEGGAQAPRLHGRYGLVLLEQRTRADERLLQEGVEPDVQRGNRLRASRSALLGSARARAARKDRSLCRKTPLDHAIARACVGV